MFGLDQNFIGTQDGISGPVKRNQIEKGIINTAVIIVGCKIIDCLSFHSKWLFWKL